MHRTALLAVAIGLGCSIVSPAFAQDPDVIVDPDWPSAKEYAIPLQSARQQATGQKGAAVPQSMGRGSARPAPLFGVGLGVERQEAARSPTTTKRKPPRVRETDASEKPTAAASPPQDIHELSAPPDSGIGEVALLGAGGLVALLTGALLGVVLRRRN